MAVEDTKEKAPCDCSCYYQFNYKISGITSEPNEITYKANVLEFSNERYLTFPIKFRVVKGDTVDLMDKYGLKQGKWSSDKDSLMINGYLIYHDGLVQKKVTLFSSGQIKSELLPDILRGLQGESFYGNKKRLNEYYPSGRKKKECYLDFSDHGYCKEWNENGKLVFNGPSEK